MNIRLTKQDKITHAAMHTNAIGGITRCQIMFYWYPRTDIMEPQGERVPGNEECDCMACIARLNPTIAYAYASINAGVISKLEFDIEDKDVK